MITRVSIKLFNLLLSLFGIILLGSIPALFNQMNLSFSGYIRSIKGVILVLVGLKPAVYGGMAGLEKPIFPQVFIHMGESGLILLLSLLAALAVALFIVFVYFLLPGWSRKGIAFGLRVLDGIPDILFMIGAQLLVIYVFKETGLAVASVATVQGERAVLLPVLSLAIPTMLMFLKLLILRFGQEVEKDYVVLARAKGVSPPAILNHHVLRNVVVSTVYYIRHHLWFILSNLYLVEVLFNVPGISWFIKDYPTTEVFTVALLLIYVPIYLSFHLFEWAIPREWRHGG
ncbi:peptide ABC transporter permease [Rossellomorea marisflavi]|uniref:ABC transporter permease subunit n=1 Tax=Rossellomorea marisflavi TaxID=189381 RepID=UPI00279E75EF|nr:ABC transporter permease subunit [Rossellomorea marisflavi]UTE72647.1 peptide ABC transporter permease [Rossellomorea marisflavi]